jgi:hypothetical protein
MIATPDARMAKSLDTLVEIPPPETPTKGINRWVLGVTAVALIAGVVLLADATKQRVPSFQWTRGEGPVSVDLDSLVALDDGFAVLSGMTSEGILLWSSQTAQAWRPDAVTDSPRQLATLGSGVLAYDGRGGMVLVREGAEWVTSAEVRFPDDIRARQSSGRPSVIPAGDGLIAMSVLGEVWWTEDRAEFQKVVPHPEWGRGQTVDVPFDSECVPPTTISPDVPPLVATYAGFVALTSGNPEEPFGIWPVCEPQAWHSADGHNWVGSDPSFGDGAYVYDLASREGLLIAIGGYRFGDPAAWASVDGESWREIDSFSELSGVDLLTIEAGAAGWVILGSDSHGPGTVGWTSTDGSCWDSLPPQVGGLDAAVSERQVLVIDRAVYPELWLGSATGSGSC